jgi:uncharacterized protein (DUF1684 family)
VGGIALYRAATRRGSVGTLPAPEPEPAPLDAAAHRAAWEQFKAKRAAFLATPGEPLSYTGLRWLHPGANTIGADSANAVVLPGRGVPKLLGTLVRDGSHVRFEPAAGVQATVDSQPATATTLRTDADSGRPSRVLVGSAGFRIIKRLDSLGVRSWDSERPALRVHDSLQYWPLDPRWRVAGRFEPLPRPKSIEHMTEAGVLEEIKVVGTVRTKIAGTQYALTAFEGEGPADLFIVFADSTSGDETYGFRFLHAARDTATNAATLDFNFAYNPDCAFTPYATCPLPPPENRLRVAVRAGERKFGHGDEEVIASSKGARR